MGRRTKDPTPVEMLLARVTYTETGYPAKLADVEDAYGGRVNPASRGPDWFWVGATPASAADIRRRGLRAVGSLTTTFFPPQTTVGILTRPSEEQVPVVGSQEHVALMLTETRERESGHGAPTTAELEAARKRLQPYIDGYPEPMIDTRRLRLANGTGSEQDRREIAAEDEVVRQVKAERR